MVRRSTFKGNKSAHPDPGRLDLPTLQTRGVVRSPIVPAPRSRSFRPGLIDMKSSGEGRNLSVFSGCARSTQWDITQSPPHIAPTPTPLCRERKRPLINIINGRSPGIPEKPHKCEGSWNKGVTGVERGKVGGNPPPPGCEKTADSGIVF